MFCNQCGKEHESNARFCSGCGAEIAVGQPAQSNQARQGASYEENRNGTQQFHDKKKEMSKHAKMLIIAGIVLVVAVGAFFMIGRGSTLPDGTYTRYEGTYLAPLGREFTVKGSKIFVTSESFLDGNYLAPIITYSYKISGGEMILTLESSEVTELYSDYVEYQLSWVADNLGKKTFFLFEKKKRGGENAYYFHNILYEKQ